ncbi:MAG: radical SAM protein [Planctomycetaceae bacterium]
MLDDTDIQNSRGTKNRVNPFQPYHWLVEPEYSANDCVEDVAAIFLTNRECPFRCLMCDLWKNTTDDRVPVGAIPAQIRFALKQLPPARHIKLYNSGNFFDAQAIPPQDLATIAELVGTHETVIVENHPKLCSERCVQFRDLCGGQLEIALGLETSHAATLATLNKQMTTDDFARACEFLRSHEIRLRTFILLRPPGVSEEQGIAQALESIRFAFNCGVDCCSVIPTRSGNGIMDRLQREGRFTPPLLRSLESVLDEAVGWQRGRVFADIWEAEQFSTCPECCSRRIDRLRRMNLSQRSQPQVSCDRCTSRPTC